MFSFVARVGTGTSCLYILYNQSMLFYISFGIKHTPMRISYRFQEHVSRGPMEHSTIQSLGVSGRVAKTYQNQSRHHHHRPHRHFACPGARYECRQTWRSCQICYCHCVLSMDHITSFSCCASCGSMILLFLSHISSGKRLHNYACEKTQCCSWEKVICRVVFNSYEANYQGLTSIIHPIINSGCSHEKWPCQ